MRLDLGCGTNTKEGYVGLDRNENYKPDIIYDINDGLYFNDVEAIWIDNSLEHFRNPYFVLSECWGALKEEGILEIIIPNYQWFPFLVIGWFIDIHKFWNWWMTLPFKKERTIHYSLWTPYTLRLVLKTLGFKIEKTKGSYLSKEYYVKAKKEKK